MPLIGTAATAQAGMNAARATGLWLIIGLLLACGAAFLIFITDVARPRR